MAQLAEAEDDRVISNMNARRSQQGKPPLTPEQEESVRENRRSERDRQPAARAKREN